jgi:ketosteroid isomerase-like protein
MSTQEIANRLVELSRQGAWKQAQSELYADDAVSIETEATPGFDAETKGLKALQEKINRWEAAVEEAHRIDISDPLVAENNFAVRMVMDLTMRGQGRVVFNEICVYTIKDGKIILEQFFY